MICSRFQESLRRFVLSPVTLLLVSCHFLSTAAAQTSPQYHPGRIVVEFTPDTQISGKSGKTGLADFDAKASRYNVYSMERVYPFLDSVAPTSKTRENLLALRHTYYVYYHAQVDAEIVAKDFSGSPGIVYSEPLPVYRFYAPTDVNAVNPNDPLFKLQTELRQLRVPEAWNEVKSENGTPRVVIAIVDGGGEWQHEDLLANVWRNEDEIPGNGKDDDNNGFIDDIHGVNFGNGDDSNNDPTGAPNAFGRVHGTISAGAASAVANNELGVAGAAWNAHLMHINSSGVVNTGPVHGYEGIVYAARNGADIISASWGAPLELASDPLFATKSLNLATDMGSLIVAASGNDGNNIDLALDYPTRHPRVLSVGSTGKSTLQRASFSNYGRVLGVFAPGEEIASTGAGNIYVAFSGTSASAPLVAGVAALVKTKFPNMSPDELREHIRLSATSIDDENPALAGNLGRGIVNAEKAVQERLDLPALRVKSSSWTDSDGNKRIDSGDRVQITATFVNYLADARQIKVRLINPESYPFISMNKSEADIASLASGDSVEVEFAFTVAANAPSNQMVRLYTHVQSGSHEDIADMFSFRVNRSLADVYKSLRAFYTAAGGDRWKNNTGWNTSAVPSEQELMNWYGIAMDNGWVIGFLLEKNNLTQSISPEIANLSHLRFLRLAGNALSGKIPPEIGNLPELTNLVLSENALSGEIPSEIGNLSKLQILVLENNELSGNIPPELGNLPQLYQIDLSGNSLSGEIPSEIGKLSRLLFLPLQNNSLSGEIPPEIGNLSQLQSLALEGNSLSGMLPRNFMQIDSLQSLSFAGQNLCAPMDDEFQKWLKKIPKVTGPTCGMLRLTGHVRNQSYIVNQPVPSLILPEAIEGTAPFTYTLSPSKLPDGLRFDPSTRILSGTPTAITPSPVKYSYRVTDAAQSEDSLQFNIEVRLPVSAERESFPVTFEILGNYPNPFRQTTNLMFNLPWPAEVEVEILDMLGRRIFTRQEHSEAGWERSIEIDGTSLSAGIYLYRLIAASPSGSSVKTGNFVRIR